MQPEKAHDPFLHTNLPMLPIVIPFRGILMSWNSFSPYQLEACNPLLTPIDALQMDQTQESTYDDEESLVSIYYISTLQTHQE